MDREVHAVRLTTLRLNESGLFRDQEIELAPLIILFGANGAGKSTILDAVEDALTPSADNFDIYSSDNTDIYFDLEGALVHSDGTIVETLDPLEPSKIGSAVVYATLGDRQIPGTSDERIMRHVLWKSLENIEEFVESNPEFVDPYVDCPPLKDLMLRRATEMIQSGTMGTPEARTRIANYLLEHSMLVFKGLHWGLVCRAPLDEIAEYAEGFDTSALDDFTNGIDDQFDELLLAIYELEYGEDAIVAMVHGDPDFKYRKTSPNAARPTLLGRIRPLPMRLAFEPATLDLELESYVDQIASRLTLRDFPRNKVSWLIASTRPEYESNSAADLINAMNDISTQASNPLNPADDIREATQVPFQAETFILSPLIRNAVERIAAHANSIAPEFLLQNSQIDVEIMSPTDWKPNSPRLRTTMNENGRKFPLALVGSGIARWASYSIRLACQELLNGTIVRDPDNDVPLPLGDVSYAPDDAFPAPIPFYGATPYEVVAALKILPSKLNVVLLLDEPEAHLHPRAVASIGEWLLEISPRVASVVVATHHPSLFNLRGIGLQKHVVLRSQETSVVEPWNPASEELVAELARQIGLTAGELFMMSRFVLFVEGPHDLVILEEFFGDSLRGCMIRLVPLHGAKHIEQLAASDIVWQMGIPIGVLTDGTNIQRVMRGERSNHIEKMVDRMLRECKTENRDVAAYGLDLDDILFYLDDGITATFASGVFPGWSKAETIWKQIDQHSNDTANGTKFKQWITKTYGLPLDRDSVRDIAKKCKAAGNIPEELSAKVSEIVAKTI